MLKIIRRVLRLSGNLSKRIWGSFICGFLESMFDLLPIAAVVLVLIELQNGPNIHIFCRQLFFLREQHDTEQDADTGAQRHSNRPVFDQLYIAPK